MPQEPKKSRKAKAGDRLAITQDTLRALFAKSGNCCAFPGCTHILFNDDNTYVANVCHIEAASPGGERYNPDMTDEERRHFDNLIALCYQHHVETDDVEKYPVERLRQMKLDHEEKHGDKPFKIDESHLHKLAMEMEAYWSEVQDLAQRQEAERWYPIVPDVSRSALEMFQHLRTELSVIRDLTQEVALNDRKIPEIIERFCEDAGVSEELYKGKVPYWYGSLNWDMMTYRIGNLLIGMSLDVCILEIKYLEEYLKTNTDDARAKKRLKDLKKELIRLTKTATRIE